ncbi:MULTISPECIES: aspartate carbamoyltransferase [Pseudomonas]|uniref:Aspartate carbamoyltransferase n=1 Tax=Pseudomonas citronellolis TaxID=53408 RepID=A0AAW6P3Q6_9PSED|nr:MULTISPECIES: aspartate carbamoyltransferase catalytic subunit [Pseudomonas]AMO75529.1 Aspartate carbamoyltransferase catalytic chain [Pseudomonas citronellolis]KRV75782.1 aspartate carbamoyltransferase [Pseudomonas citronellolis]KRW80362.1 aspartate carbamoyltransferase [Pseudomonas citronellolis]MBB1608822.1 aspartate carbamoyltransferase [Pseudomonas sp. UMC76]MBB1637657.1 aspartate carbamoyltransferase [Pseudomonas sp. UME83]
MALDQNFKTLDIRDHLAATQMRGRNITFLDDFSSDQLGALFQAARQLEPFMRTGLDLLRGKVLYTLFFQPSTRTRCSHEDAMLRLGGSVITESDPLHNSSAAKNESLYDSLRVTSEYADVIVMRHPDDREALETLAELEGHASPVISGGYGHVTHPTQGLLDCYTCWRAFGDLSRVTVAIATPDLSRARSGQSFALALAAMGAKIIYTGTSELRTPAVVRDKLVRMGAQFEEHFDLSESQNKELYIERDVDLIYLPGCSVKKDDPNREDFVKTMAKYYLSMEMLQEIRQKTGKVVGVHHSLPRNPGEFDFAIDNTEHQLYFRAIGFSVAIRMALLCAVVGVN